MAKPRSLDQHRRFFGVIAAAFEQWPERHPFQPENSEHLRAWLQTKAGYHTVRTFEMDGDARETARLMPVVIATMLSKHAWCRARGTELHVCVPQSIAFDKMGHEEFCALNDAVDEVIRTETGLDPELLLKEKERAA